MALKITPLIETMVDAAVDASAVVTPDLRLHYYNRRYASLTGIRHRDMQRNSLAAMCHSHFDLDSCDGGNCVALQAISRRRPIRVDEVASRKLNLKLIVTAIPLLDVTGQAYAAIESYRDVTAESRVQERFRVLLEKERKHSEHLEQEVRRRTLDLQNSLEELTATRVQLVQAEKMSSLGRLVAGVAHELNNPLNFSLGNLNFIDDYSKRLLEFCDWASGILADSDKEAVEKKSSELELNYVRADLTQVVSSVRNGMERVSRIISDLKTFSRQDVHGFRFVDLNQVISTTLNLAAPRALPRVKVIRDLHSLPDVCCNAAQIGQAVINLLNNALDAIKNDGTITVRSRFDEGAGRVTLEVEDNGMGMAPDAIEKAFEPFFTTKDPGKGTGLGLSIAFGIAQAHGGTLEAVSAVGEGSTFRLTVPVSGPKIPHNQTMSVSA